MAGSALQSGATAPFTSRETLMTKNVGSIDRTLRIIAGIALIALAVTGTVGVWGYIGVVPLLTALMGHCPAYSLLGIKTCTMQHQ